MTLLNNEPTLRPLIPMRDLRQPPVGEPLHPPSDVPWPLIAKCVIPIFLLLLIASTRSIIAVLIAMMVFVVYFANS